MTKLTRQEVYSLIDGERDYQDYLAVKSGTELDSVRPHSTEEFVLYMEDYLSECKTILSRTWTKDRVAPPEALAALRKVTTLGVACMEQHGAPPRVFTRS